MHRIALALAVFAGACAPEPVEKTPGSEFRKDTDVLVTSPTNGETVESPFALAWTAGADVEKVRIEIDGEVVAGPLKTQETGELSLTVGSGRHELVLFGLTREGEELSQHSITLRVADAAESWVTITSPSDGSIVTNPVVFAVDASADAASIELFAEGWSLGTMQPGGILSYEFTGVGFERHIEARALDAGGNTLATDAITLTVDPGTEPIESDFNAIVLDILATYPTDGSYGYYWPSSGSWPGTTRDLYYQGELVAEGDDQHRSYCSGITWETFMRSWMEVDLATGGDGSLNGMTVDDLQDFRVDWFVRELFGDGPGVAIEGYGIGESVTRFEDVEPGDFVQIWRHSGSGHTLVFIDWLRDGGGDIEGVRYWSTQSSTDGIGYNEEYFGTSGSALDPNLFFAARVYGPEDWITWF